MCLLLSYCPYSEKNVKFDGAKCKMQIWGGGGGGKKTKQMGVNEKNGL